MTTPWTKPQLTAIEHVQGDLLVSAAAGSGKTAVLAERCARLVCEVDAEQGGCGVDGLLVLTFTEASANEMRGRIADAIRQKLKSPGKRGIDHSRWLRRQAAMVDRASISTLHAFCAKVLRQHFHEAQIDPSFEVIDEDEARLMREDVLTELLARSHTQKPVGGATDSAFAEFLEAYAQGRESICRDMILKVYRMLSSTADPVAYVAAAREIYSPAGCAATLDRFVQQTVAGQVGFFSLTARRAAQEVKSAMGPGVMSDGLQNAATLIDWAQTELREKGAAVLPAVRDALSYKWPTLKTPKDVPNFDSLKKRTWERVKEKMKSLCADVLVGDAAGLLKDLAALAKPLDTLLKLVDDFTAAYIAAKRAQNRLDFTDLERLTLDCLTAPNSLAAQELRARYCHILVDEFQDINPLQAQLLHTLRSPERFAGAGNLFVVGDVKQSIYGFRLAEPALFLARESAARAAHTEAAHRYIALPHNFRSHPNLLQTMNDIFDKLLTFDVTGITYSNGHALQPPPNRQPAPEPPALLNGSPVELCLVAMKEESDDDENPETTSDETQTAPSENLSAVEEEARLVADRIATLMRQHRTITGKDGQSRNLKYRDIAILLRTMKNKAMIFARALAARGIPVHADLSTGYFDTAEVRDTLALLQVLDNPHQDIPLATVLLGPYGRFSHDDVATLRLAYDRKLVPFPEAVMRYAEEAHRANPIPDAVKNSPLYSADLAKRVAMFLEKIAIWRARLRTRPLHEGLAEIFADAKIFPYLAGTPAGSQRVANLQSLHQRALKFAGFRKQGLHRFLRFIEKLRDQDGDFGEAPVLSEASDVVRIMSVHKSKGLEFPVVVVAGLGGMLNLMESGPVFVHRDLGIGLQVADIERNIFYHSAASATIVDSNKRTGRAEELRLLYVALTRARDYLILSGHIGKPDDLNEVRANWQNHTGPLPEDVLLKGRTVLDWLLPALACCGPHVQWPDENLGTAARLTITLHPATGASATSPETQLAQQDETVRRLIAAQPLPESPPPNAAVTRLVARVTGNYSHEPFTRLPAVATVSQLKMLEDEEAAGDEMPAARPPRPHGSTHAGALEARQRGVATHRVLELLDFTRCATPDAITACIQNLITEKHLAPEEAACADHAGITWFLTQSAAGKRLLQAASQNNAGNAPIDIRREIPFAWASPSSAANPSDDPADWPTIRGVIDILLVNPAAKQAEILDYKTDSIMTWEKNADEYARQMNYYLRAASDILGFAVTRATLVFVAAKVERTVQLD